MLNGIIAQQCVFAAYGVENIMMIYALVPFFWFACTWGIWRHAKAGCYIRAFLGAPIAFALAVYMASYWAVGNLWALRALIVIGFAPSYWYGLTGGEKPWPRWLAAAVTCAVIACAIAVTYIVEFDFSEATL